jgi:DNA polymerase-3 subunit delta
MPTQAATPRTLHGLDFLETPELPSAPLCVLHGTEPFLKQQVWQKIRQLAFGDEFAQVPIATLSDPETPWRDVLDELSTAPLFGGPTRLVFFESADQFVTEQRDQLEAYVASPSKSSMLVLDVATWPSNTRLARWAASHGLAIACRLPEIKRGNNKPVTDRNRLLSWIVQWARTSQSLDCSRDAAKGILDLVGDDLGLIDQELAKLAVTIHPATRVTVEQVRQVVGGWRMQTIWQLVEAACDCNGAAALGHLDRLIKGRQDPMALFGAWAWSLRRVAAAHRLREQRARAGKSVRPNEALEVAGFKNYEWQRAERLLRRLGSQRAGALYRKLAVADLKLKRTHSSESRARWVLEELILDLTASPPS